MITTIEISPFDSPLFSDELCSVDIAPTTNISEISDPDYSPGTSPMDVDPVLRLVLCKTISHTVAAASLISAGRCEIISGRCEMISGRCEMISGPCERISGPCEMISGRLVDRWPLLTCLLGV